MSDDPKLQAGQGPGIPPGAPAAPPPLPEHLATPITVSVTPAQVLEWLRSHDQKDIQQGLNWLRMSAALADLPEVEAAIAMRMEMFGLGLPFPCDYLEALIGRSQPPSDRTLACVVNLMANHPDARVKAVAMRVLGKHAKNRPEVVDEIHGATFDPSPEVIMAAVSLLGDMSSDPIGALESLLFTAADARYAFWGKPDQDPVRGTCFTSMVRVLATEGLVVPEDLVRRLLPVLLTARKCRHSFVSDPADTALRLLRQRAKETNAESV